MTTWRCFECNVTGLGSDQLDALIRFERHYLTRHYKPRRGAA